MLICEETNDPGTMRKSKANKTKKPVYNAVYFRQGRGRDVFFSWSMFFLPRQQLLFVVFLQNGFMNVNKWKHTL